MKREKGKQRAPETERIELPEKVSKGRRILFIVLIVIALGAFTYGISTLLNPGSGWEEINTTKSETNCARDFTLLYETGRSGAASVSERKQLSTMFTRVMTEGYRAFSVTEDFEDTVSVHAINTHPNEEVKVGQMLYNALKTLGGNGARYLYYGPVYEQYRALFYSNDDTEALDYDPLRNEETAEYISDVLRWCADPEAVKMTFSADNTVCLKVSEAYLAFAKEYGFDTFIDCYVYGDAFIADALAEQMKAAGLTRGCVSSTTGYVRNLDTKQNQYTLALSDGRGHTSKAYYNGGISVVMLGDHALAADGTPWYYRLPDGTVRVPYIDPADGACRAGAALLAGGASGMTCGELLVRLLPVWFGETADTESITHLAGDGISAVIWNGTVPMSSGTEMSVAPAER